MIVSDKYKFVYLDIPKTASRSLDAVFKKLKGHSVDRGRLTKHNRQVPPRAKNYLRIVSVRNPYTRIVSHYYDNIRKKLFKGTFESYIDYSLKQIQHDSNTPSGGIYRYFPCWKWIEPIGYDIVIHMETIEKDLLQLPFKVEKPKRTGVTIHPLWKEIKTEILKQKVQEWAGKDFELFNYEK